MVKLAYLFYLLGALFAGAAAINLRERRWAASGFWAILAVPFLVGDRILEATKAGTRWPAQVMGAAVIALGLLATRTRSPSFDGDRAAAEAREASAARHGNRLFIPALAIPALTVAFYFGAGYLQVGSVSLIDRSVSTQVALIALGLAVVVALIMALAMTRARPYHALGEGRRLLDTLGWAAVLPIALATLGSVFDKTGVGAAVTKLAVAVLPTDSAMVCLVAYALGMVVLTAIMGNAFAAFPVMTAGIGVPLLIHGHGATPATLGALGMLTGYCGTLLTPMAANFNIVPARLLELRDPYGVIRAQWPTALAMIVANLALLALFVFP